MYPNLSNFVVPRHVPRPFNTYHHVSSHPLEGSSFHGGTVTRVFRNQLHPRLLLLAIEGGPVSRVRHIESFPPTRRER